jgi:sugar phosphate isomerase/epimerase
VAAIGFRNIQLSGVPEALLSPAEIVQICRDNGISICATHEDSTKILENPKAIAERLEALQTRYTAYPFPKDIDFTCAESVARWLEQLENSAQILREHGKTLCYHNHNHEFIRLGESTLFEQIYSRTSLAAELDTYWVQAGGASPLEWVQRLAGEKRLPLLHMKDYRIAPPTEAQFAEIGAGNINFKPIVQAALEGGCEYFIIEQDQTYGRDPFESIAQSFAAMREL